MDVPDLPDGPARLTGRWLACARGVWLALAAVIVGLLVAGVPTLVGQLHTVCTAPGCTAAGWQPTPDGLLALQASGVSVDRYVALVVAVTALSAAIWIGVGAVIYWRNPSERMALLVAFFLLTGGASLSSPLLGAASTIHPALRLLTSLVQLAADANLGLFFSLFPNGRFVPRWTRWLALGWVVSQAPTDLFPDSPLDARSWPAALFLLVVPTFFGTFVSAQIWRYRRASGSVERQQTKWVVYGLTVALTGLIVLIAIEYLVVPGRVASGSLGSLLILAAVRGFLLLVPISIAIAVLRYRLWDVDLLINRTLVYGGLTAGVVGLYVFVVAYLGVLFHTGGNLVFSLVATGLVAVLFQPIRERLQRGVNHLLYGERDEPYAVLTRLSRRLEASLAPESALTTVVQTVREALRLSYAAVSLARDGDQAIVAAAGVPVPDPVRLPLVYQGEAVGELLLAPRAPGEAFGLADQRLLDDLARQAGVAAHAVRLTAELRRAREQLVTAREEERRRLRRDLHDGLGPQLASQALTIDAARTLITRDLAAADTLLIDLKTQAQAAVVDVRRLVDGLRPPALDELGLVATLTERAVGYERAGLKVTIEVPEPLPQLPAAVEVAAFRIVQEALTNVVRHAAARHALVRLLVAGSVPSLTVEVCDDGRGLSSVNSSGVGLASMRERAEELGGDWLSEVLPTGGTRVRARIPLPKEDEWTRSGS